ncbi:LPXTG cell wall anchor domain-containing protein [Lentibacillus sediminis]|uniref:LPXTG cell wall anchor domain-containing protein n=1 Tax=Lentibacillus sediminis TaxID=1940529 RepID=UPI0013046076|nr:LPXTG cell wall anchor domain-containing protein [Lentibacillus sediminis]
MMHKSARLIIAGIAVFLFSLGFSWPTAAEEGNEIDIQIEPQGVLFDVANMKPGDWAPRTVVIQNNGSSAFDYVVSLRNESKANKLFNELLLEVRGGEQELFSGKLADFQELAPRSLTSFTEEELQFTVRFPEHLDNDFQGLSARFALIFSTAGQQQDTDEAVASGVVGSGSRGEGAAGGSILPDTASNMFNYLLIGLLLLFSGAGLFIYRKLVKKINPTTVNER